MTVLTSAAAGGLDPEPALRRHAAHVPPADVDAVLVAHAGFLVAGWRSGGSAAAGDRVVRSRAEGLPP